MDKLCNHLDCEDEAVNVDFCRFHGSGGVFASGETYEQYQVIEEGFINFIKIIPLYDERNMTVCSPVLRDLIIRNCVQIEIFFKEWAKFECAKNASIALAQKEGGAKSWNIKDYFYFKPHVEKRSIYVRELNKNINPFDEWELKKPPAWWSVYNSIKHNGIQSKNECNLKMALESLCGLFLLHCANNESRKYLEQYSSISATRRTFGKTKITFDKIKTPLDSKKYLFQDAFTRTRSVEIVDDEEYSRRANGIGRKV